MSPPNVQQKQMERDIEKLVLWSMVVVTTAIFTGFGLGFFVSTMVWP